MAPKKTNIKIKRSKFNLYNKKKSKARRALKIILTVVIICGLGVLGYGLGKPLIKYLQDKNSSHPESETSALLSSIRKSGNTVSTAISSTNTSSSTDDTSKPDPIQQAPKIYYLADNAASSESNLKAALAEAKNSGCSVVAVTLKDTSGYLLYKSSIESIKETEVSSGTLTASQIASTISKEGLTPAARINTLLDKTAPLYIEGGYRFPENQGGYGWHDGRPENGGKLWLSPFSSNTVEYIGSVCEELSKSGFKHIICANTRYPAFHGQDVTGYLPHLPLNDSAKRTDALWDVLESAKSGAEKNGAKLIIEVSASAVMADNRSCSDAELMSNKSKMTGCSFIVNYDISKDGASQTPSASTNTSKPTVTTSTPTESTTTTEPTTPTEPSEPTTPESSSSAASITPTTPTEPSTPAASTKPTTPTEPSIPAASTKPTTPTEPSTSAASTTPTSRSTVTSDVSVATNSPASTTSTSSFTATPGTVVKTVPNGTTEYEMAKQFAAKAKSSFGNASFSVYLPQTLTGNSRRDVSKALSEANIAVIQ